MNPPTNIAGYDPTRHTAGCVFDPDAAQHAVDFFAEILTHPDDSPTTKAGDPFVLQPWQRDFVATLYGWKRPDGLRRYTEAMGGVPRKNGKTAVAAGLALYSLVADGNVNAQIYSAAMDREQASAIYRWASRMVLQSPRLLPRLTCIDSRKRIVNRRTASFYEALSGDASTGHSKKPKLVLFDELHTQSNRRLYDSLQTGMGASLNRLFIAITTAGWDRNSICYDVWQRARRVRDTHGVDDPYFLPMLYELKEGDDWEDERVWAKCNPNLGVSISRDFLREEFAKAKQSPAYENTFRNLYLNEWTEQAVRWLPMHHWDASTQPLPDLTGLPCWCGLDMSSTTDVTAFAMVFRLDGGKYAVLPHFWIPGETARRKEQQDHVPYTIWKQQGYVSFTDGNRIDHFQIADDIARLTAPYNVQEITVDRALAELVERLLQETGYHVTEFPQTIMHLTGPSKMLEKLVLGRELIHGGNPVLRWMASNVAIERDKNENIRPVKDKSTGRIDGIVAAIMALGAAASSESPVEGSLFLV